MAETAIIYGRASRDPKRLGTSVDAQIDECRQWAKANGVEIAHVVRDDDRSASRSAKREREGYIEVLRLLRSRSVDLLLVWESSRASRDVEEFVQLFNTCEQVGIEVVMAGSRMDPGNPEHRLVAFITAASNEAEAGRIRERNLRTVRRTAEAGRPHGRLPYGYQRVYDPTTGRLLRQEPDETQAQILREAAHELLQGGTLRGICRRLNEEGIKTPRTPRRSTPAAEVVHLWDPSTLRQLLLNPTIAGLRRHQGKILGEADWEAIIPEEDWLRLKAFLTSSDRLTVKTPRGPAPRHLLTGIAVCGECGARVKAATNIVRMPRAYVCRAEGCMRVAVSADRADEVVLGVLHAYFERDDVREVISRAQQQRAANSGGAGDDDLPTLRGRLDELAEEFAAGKISASFAGRAEAAIEKRITAEQARLAVPVPDTKVQDLLDAADLWAGWQQADLQDQRHLLKSLFRITIKRAQKRGRVFDPQRVLVELAPG